MTEERFLRLRAEWLKIKGYLQDPITGLPALAAVLEDVRRQVEERQSVGLIYLDLKSEEQLEEIYGWETYDSLIRQLSTALSELLTERDIVAVRGVRSDEFLIFMGERAGGQMSQAAISRFRDLMVHRLSSRLQVQVGTESPRGLGIHANSTVLRYDPTVRIERQLYRAVDQLKIRCHHEREQELNVRLNELRRILASGDVRVRYQPIVWLSDRAVYGFEALSGGPEGDLFEDSEVLFSFAEKTDHLLQLERLCRLQCLRGAARLPRGHKLFLNCSVRSVEDTEFLSGRFLEQAMEAGLGVEDMVLEITERVAVTSWQKLRCRLNSLRRQGFAVAIDDMGAGYSSLQTVAEIEPDYLKFDISLVRDIHLSPIKRNLLESLVSLGRSLEAGVIAEGVEKQEEFETLREMGVTFGQGFFFSPPGTLMRYTPKHG